MKPVRTSRILKIALSGLMILLLAGMIQPGYADTYSKSVSSSIKHLLEHNRDFKKYEAEWRLARLNVREAASAALPTVAFDGSYTRLGNVQSFEIDFDGDAPDSEPPQSIKATSEDLYKGTLSVHQQIFSGSVFGAIGVARSYKQAADYTLTAQKNGLVKDFLIAYAQMQMLEDIEELNREMVASTKSHFEETKLLYDIGATDNYTLLRAEVEHLNSIPAMKEAEKNLKAARSTIRLMLNLETDTELATHSFDVDLNLPDDLSSLLDFAAGKRPEISSLNYVTQAYKRAVNVYRAARWPSVAGFYNYERQNQWDMFSQTNLYNNSWNAGVTVSLPLFTGFKTTSQIQKGKLDLLKAEKDHSMLDDQIRIEVQLAYDDYKRSSSDFDAWYRNVELADEGFRIAQLRRTSGSGSELELQDARVAKQSAHTNLSRAKYDLVRAKIELLFAVGAMESISIIETEKSE